MRLDGDALKLFALELAAVIPPPPPRPDEVGGMVLDPSPRARAIRRIVDIADARGWQIAVTRALDAHRARYFSDLSDQAVFELRDRMERYEECAELCCDPDDALPAR